MITPGRTTPRTWLTALVVTLALHLAALVGMAVFRPFEPAPVEASPPEAIQLVFSEPAPAPRPDEPSFFTEQPEDRAAERPETAEALSNVDAAARDETPGGSDARPRSEGASEAPALAFEAGAPGSPLAQEAPEETENPLEEPTSDETAPEDPLGGLEPHEKPETTPPQESPTGSRRNPLEGLLRPKPGTDAPEAVQPPTGRGAYYQEATDARDANAALPGEVTLSTYAWDFAPWMQQFGRDFRRNWYAPYAFYAGLIEGWHVVRVEIDRDGRVIATDLGDKEGDASLVQASLAALEAAAPFQPLPEDFPDPTLVITLKLIYQHRSR